MSINELFQSIIDDHTAVLQRFCSADLGFKKIGVIADMLLDSYRGGNGGSAADAQHIAAELVGRFYLDRPGIDAEALTVNASSLTSIANDYSFDKVFSRQVEAKGKPGDVLIGITTSGTSKNILAAFSEGRKIGMKNICFSGEKAPASLEMLCDAVLRVPSSCTPRIQEMHMLIGHILCEYVEGELFGTSAC